MAEPPFGRLLECGLPLRNVERLEPTATTRVPRLVSGRELVGSLEEKTRQPSCPPSIQRNRLTQLEPRLFVTHLDDRFRNSMAIADGACAARSRREEEDDALPSSTTTNEEIARNPRLPNGLRARVRTQTLSCADEHLRYIQFDL